MFSLQHAGFAILYVPRMGVSNITPMGKLLDQILPTENCPCKKCGVSRESLAHGQTNLVLNFNQSIMNYPAPMYKCFKCFGMQPAAYGAAPAAKYPHTKNTRWEPNFKVNRILGNLHQSYFSNLQCVSIIWLFNNYIIY